MMSNQFTRPYPTDGTSGWARVLEAVLDEIRSFALSLRSDVNGKANTSHTHTIGQVNGLQTSLDRQASDLTSGLDRLASDLTSGLASKANLEHIHTVGQITNLQALLNGKSSINHGHESISMLQSETVSIRLAVEALQHLTTFLKHDMNLVQINAQIFNSLHGLGFRVSSDPQLFLSEWEVRICHADGRIIYAQFISSSNTFFIPLEYNFVHVGRGFSLPDEEIDTTTFIPNNTELKIYLTLRVPTGSKTVEFAHVYHRVMTNVEKDVIVIKDDVTNMLKSVNVGHIVDFIAKDDGCITEIANVLSTNTMLANRIALLSNVPKNS
jgi:hypothetical protein